MELGNQTFTAPKISRSNISSPLSSGASRISGVTPRLRSSRISFRSSGIGRSSLVSSQSSVETTLAETNQILVEIQNQLAIDFALRNAEEKQKNQTLKQEKSRRRFALRESAVESIKKIGGAIKKTASFVATPVKGFFDQMLEFVSLLGLGIGANAVFKWFADEENREKLGKFFNIITSNWKLIRNILTTIGAIWAGKKILGVLGTLLKVIKLLSGPVGLAIVTGLATFKLMKDSERTTNRILRENGIDPEKAKIPGSEEAKKAEKVLLGAASNPLTMGLLGPILIDQTRNEDGTPKDLGKIDPEKGVGGIKSAYDIPVIGNILQALAPDQYKEYLLKETEARVMGGPVTSGSPYIVGEKGPEFFIPNINGSVVNNFRTEKIYEMISSKGAGKINYITMDLPPIDARQPKSSPTPLAPKIPAISSVNSSNPYMSVTPGIYGIYV